MQKLKIFKITEDEIISSKNITPRDVVLVLNHETKNLYVYRGKYSPPIDEFKAKRLYERLGMTSKYAEMRLKK